MFKNKAFFKESKLRKYKDKASYLVDKGKYKKALSIYKDILAAFPDDTSIMLKVGALCRKLEMNNQAVAVYSAAAEFHAQSGRLLQAIAVCRLILEIDASHSATQKKLATWYAEKYGGSDQSRAAGAPASRGNQAKSRVEEIHEEKEDVSTQDKKNVSVQNNDDVQPPHTVKADSPYSDQRSSPAAPVTDVLDTTAPLLLDFSNTISRNEEDSEISEVYDINDLEEYKAELEATGEFNLSNEDISRLDPREGPSENLDNEHSLMLMITPPSSTVQNVPSIPLFSSLSESELLDLINHLPLRHFDALETVVEEGEYGDSFFIIAAGSAEVFKQGESLAILEEGAFFGEMGMLLPGARQASVITIEPCELFEVSNAQLEKMKAKHPRVGQKLMAFAENRLLDNLLHTSAMFAPFCEEDRKSLMEKFEQVVLEDRQVVIEEGKPSAGLYLIVAGSAMMTMDSPAGEELVIRELQGNDIFGEVSLLLRRGALASVTAVGECRALLLPKDRFDELIMTHPQVLELVSAISMERMTALKEIKARATVGRRTSML